MEFNLAQIKERWNYVLECLGNDFGLDAFLETQYCGDFYEWEKYNGRVLAQSLDYFDSKLYFSSGVSKACFFFENDDYVIKIPFVGVSISDAVNDYCELEERNYELAKRNGYEGFFAETKFLMNYKYPEADFEIPIYISVRADVNQEIKDEIESVSWHDISDPQPVRGEDEDEFWSLYEMNGIQFPAVKDYFVYKYGEKTLDGFWDFLYNSGINDLHMGNVGLIDDKPVFIDYSGFDG